jgi:hypothetical protein
VLFAMLGTGCALSHESGAPIDDAGPSFDDAPFVIADAFVANDAATMPNDAAPPPNDAWVSTFMIAPHAPEPIVPDQGGPRMTHPQLVVITFADDPRRSISEDDVRWLASSNWLVTVGAEYGVGSGSVLGVVERTDAAPTMITDSQIAMLIANGIADHSLPAPASLDEVLYVIYFPDTTTISGPIVGTSCTTFAGYHYSSTTADGRTFTYAVLPTCHVMSDLSDLELQQVSLAHEVIEAATDSRPLLAPAFAMSTMTATVSPWAAVGGELGDMCELRSGPAATVHEAGFAAPRIWSNAAAMAGDRDPCVPNDGATPYLAMSITPDQVVAVAPGSNTTFDVLGWTSAPAPPFTIAAYAVPATGMTFEPSVSLDRSTLTNGLHATLTMGVPPGVASGTYGVAYVYVIDGADSNPFPAVVYAP